MGLLIRIKIEKMSAELTAAAERIRDPANKVESSNAQKLELYGLYKQATVGDVTGSQPWAVQLEARAKWDAWNAIKGMSKEQAMQEYIDECLRQKEEFDVTDPEGKLDFKG